MFVLIWFQREKCRKVLITQIFAKIFENDDLSMRKLHEILKIIFVWNSFFFFFSHLSDDHTFVIETETYRIEIQVTRLFIFIRFKTVRIYMFYFTFCTIDHDHVKSHKMAQNKWMWKQSVTSQHHQWLWYIYCLIQHSVSIITSLI